MGRPVRGCHGAPPLARRRPPRVGSSRPRALCGRTSARILGKRGLRRTTRPGAPRDGSRAQPLRALRLGRGRPIGLPGRSAGRRRWRRDPRMWMRRAARRPSSVSLSCRSFPGAANAGRQRHDPASAGRPRTEVIVSFTFKATPIERGRRARALSGGSTASRRARISRCCAEGRRERPGSRRACDPSLRAACARAR
jgi:hypothetical protein